MLLSALNIPKMFRDNSNFSACLDIFLETTNTGTSKYKLDTYEYIETGESLTSRNKCFRLDLKRSGLITLYRLSDGLVLWNAGTPGLNFIKTNPNVGCSKILDFSA